MKSLKLPIIFALFQFYGPLRYSAGTQLAAPPTSSERPKSALTTESEVSKDQVTTGRALHVSGKQFGYILPKQNLSIYLSIGHPNAQGVAECIVHVKALNANLTTNKVRAIVIDQNNKEIVAITIGVDDSGLSKVKLSEEAFGRIFNVTFK